MAGTLDDGQPEAAGAMHGRPPPPLPYARQLRYQSYPRDMMKLMPGLE